MRKLKKMGLRRLGSKGKGFTLIELLIVLSILAILVAVVVLSLTGFIGRGQEQACATDRRSLQEAALAFFTEEQIWPTAADAAGDNVLCWANDDPIAACDAEDALTPGYVVEKPGTATNCTWYLDAQQIMQVKDAGGGNCPCD